MLWLWHITNQEDSHDNNLLQEGQLEETSFQAQPVQRHNKSFNSKECHLPT